MSNLNRRKLQTIAKHRVEDAKTLLLFKRYAAAYYLVGYAVECALKAKIAKQIRRHDFPDKQLAMDSHIHSLEKLIKLAGMEPELKVVKTTNQVLYINWTIVKDWRETSRYEIRSKQEAIDMFNAVTEATNGVMIWIEKFW